MKPTATDINRRSFLKVAAAGGAAVWSDVAFAAAPSIGGRVTAAGRGMGPVVVTDGLNCTETAEDGSWSLPMREGVRFVSVTTPSGWRASCHYIRFAGSGASYDFDLLPWSASSPGPFSFMHIGDRAYFGSQRKGLVCFDLKTFDLAWTAPVEDALLVTLHYQYPPIQSLSSCPVFWKGLVWATCQDGALYAWDPATGERKERIFTGVPYTASATLADGKLYAVDFTGGVRCFN